MRELSRCCFQSKEVFFFLLFFSFNNIYYEFVFVHTFYFEHTDECGSNSIGTKKSVSETIRVEQSTEFTGGVLEESSNDGDWQ